MYELYIRGILFGFIGMIISMGIVLGSKLIKCLSWLLFITILFLILFPVYAEVYGPYNATVYEVIDGDSIKMDIHVWPGLTQRINVRLSGIDTPELKTSRQCERSAAESAKAYIQGQVLRAETVTVTDITLGKYAGRVIGRVLLDGEDLSEKMINAGHARAYQGGKRLPWCSE